MLMNIPQEKWYKALQVRRSKRKYENREIDGDVLKRLDSFIKEVNSTVDGVRIILVCKDTSNIFTGILGSYGKIEGAPAYAAFIGRTDTANIDEKIGYYGEGFVLEATSLGLGTCWVAGTFNPDVVKREVGLSDNEKLFCITPVGYVKQKRSFDDKMMSSIGNNRKSLKILGGGIDIESIPEWMQTALESARIAPSAANRQPWRFSVKESNIKIGTDNLSKIAHASLRLDCGIAMLHIEVGALYEGVKGKWEYMSGKDVAVFKPAK
jgi:nitroreductase